MIRIIYRRFSRWPSGVFAAQAGYDLVISGMMTPSPADMIINVFKLFLIFFSCSIQTARKSSLTQRTKMGDGYTSHFNAKL
jgi:hypothetical protein